MLHFYFNRMILQSASLCLSSMALATSVSAQDITYQPVNPSFGGNPFNSNHLLALANAQNKKVDPKAASNQSQADLFSRQLQSRLLSALSSQITEAIFGENPQERGTITFGGQTISFVRSLDNVSLTITNNETGEVTNIVIPTFIEVN
jgi:curli production assembly/transport component CsgF